MPMNPILGYLAPEQLAHREPTERSDLYSFGAILYEMITRQPLFAAESVEQLLRLRQGHGPVRLRQLDPDIPVALERIVLTLLGESPDRRYPSALLVLDALQGIEPWDSPTPRRGQPVPR